MLEKWHKGWDPKRPVCTEGALIASHITEHVPASRVAFRGEQLAAGGGTGLKLWFVCDINIFFCFMSVLLINAAPLPLKPSFVQLNH